jgi:hypothetical protein
MCVQAEGGTTICVMCLQASGEITGMVSVGAIACLKCKKHDKIVVEYVNKTRIEYAGDVLDANGVVAYRPAKFKGVQDKPVGRLKSSCGHCKTDIPLYLLTRSDYIL